MCCLRTPPRSTPCSAGTRAWSASGRTWPPRSEAVRMTGIALELDDIQSGVLRARPTPYAATYIGLRIEDPKAGRELMRRLAAVVTSAASPTSPLGESWVSVALTYRGLEALGVARASLESFAWEFRRGMAANAKGLGDTE